MYVLLTGRVSEREATSAFPSRSIDVRAPAGGGIGLTTTYPGLVLAALGTLLHVAGYLGSRFLKQDTTEVEHDDVPKAGE